MGLYFDPFTSGQWFAGFLRNCPVLVPPYSCSEALSMNCGHKMKEQQLCCGTSTASLVVLSQALNWLYLCPVDPNLIWQWSAAVCI